MNPGRGSLTARENNAGSRLDALVADSAEISRNRAQKLIEQGLVQVDGMSTKKNHIVSSGELVEWQLPSPEPEALQPQELPLEVVYEDRSILVVDKPAGMVMYPGPGHHSDTLLNALLSAYPDIAGVGGRGRPGVFHRLDRGTSGLVAIARTDQTYQAMVEKIRAREVTREYIALATGTLPAESGTIDAPLSRSRGNRKKMAVDRVRGKRAVSRFRVRERFGPAFTLVEVSLETGRTHQIRVHFSHIGHPLAGDQDYSRRKACGHLGLERQFLHAFRLEFEHPVSGERLELKSALPGDLQCVLELLRRES